MKRPWTLDELRERASRLPRISLTSLPTPLEECRRLSDVLGGGVRLFMKRDDLTSLGCGGNKVRKLEFGVAEAKAAGCDVVVQALAGQSNFCRQTAAAAARVGLPCVLVLRQDHKAGDPPQGNRLLDYVFGAEVHMCRPGGQREALAAIVERLTSHGRKPYVVGRRDEVLGAVAYALCLAEILEQQAAVGVKADYVCVTGRGGTTAGLVLGKRLLGFAGEILAFDVAPHDEDDPSWREGTAQIATEAAALLGAEEQFTVADIHNTGAYAGTEYGVPTEACLDALLLLGRTEGLVVGPVYTAKGLSGVIDYVRTGRIRSGSAVVFLHTGGIPETFAYNTEIVCRLGPGA